MKISSINAGRHWFGFGALMTALSLVAAYYIQYAESIEPCPLCLIQRFVWMGFGIICLAGTLHGKSRTMQRMYAVAAAFIALAGMALAGRQLFLIYGESNDIPSCLPSLAYMVDNLPLQKIIDLLLKGSADCAEINWTFLGFNLPELSFAGFSMALLIAILATRPWHSQVSKH